MTTLDLNLDQIARNAVALKPLRVLFWILAAPFVIVLFVLRFAWLLPAFAIGAGMEGWRSADKLIKQMQAQARESSRRGG